MLDSLKEWMMLIDQTWANNNLQAKSRLFLYGPQATYGFYTSKRLFKTEEEM